MTVRPPNFENGAGTAYAQVGPEIRNVLAVIYGSSKLGDGLLETTAREVQSLLAEFASAQDVEWRIW